LAVPIGAETWLLLPAEKMAYAKLLVGGNEVFQHPQAQIAFQRFRREQVDYFKSQLVLDAALMRPDIAVVRRSLSSNPGYWMQRHIKVDFPEPQIMRVSIQRPDSGDAKLLLTAVIESYMAEVVDKEKHELERRQKELALLERKPEKLKNKDTLDLLNKRIQELKVKLQDPPRVSLLEPPTIGPADNSARLAYSIGAGLLAFTVILFIFALVSVRRIEVQERTDEFDEDDDMSGSCPWRTRVVNSSAS
jgi:hypothetical protein